MRHSSLLLPLVFLIAVGMMTGQPAASAESVRSAMSAKSDLPTPSGLKGGRLSRDPAGRLVVDNTRRQIRVCTPERFVAGCDYRNIDEAVRTARPNDIVVVAPGIYQQGVAIRTPGLTLKGEPGAHLKGQAVEGKAAIVVKADDVVIDGIECSDIKVRDSNGACIRVEAVNLIVRNVYFHDNEEGILAGGKGGTLIVENSRFERNGLAGRAHGVYVSGQVESFVFRNNQVLDTMDSGHGVKSRARRTIIENNVIASLHGKDSRAIDIPNGGDIVIRGNVLQKGPNSENWQMIGLALEGKGSGLHPVNKASIEDNVFIFDSKKAKVLQSELPGPIIFRNNKIIGLRSGNGEIMDKSNVVFASRRAAGLPPFPALPAVSP